MEVSAKLKNISFSSKFKSNRRKILREFNLKTQHTIPEGTPKRIRNHWGEQVLDCNIKIFYF